MAKVKPVYGSMQKALTGDFAQRTVMSFQNLRCAKSFSIHTHWEQPLDLLPEKKSGLSGLTSVFNSEKIKGEIFGKISSQLSAFLIPDDMRSLDLSTGGFVSRLTDGIAEHHGHFVCFEMPVVVNMDYVPHEADFSKKPASLREQYKQFLDVELPQAVQRKFYIVAPEDKVRAIIQMVDALTLQKSRNHGEFLSSQPLYLHEYVAYHEAPDRIKDKIFYAPKAIAWFELKEHFLMTVNRSIYEAFSAGVGAKSIDLLPKVEKVYNEEHLRRQKAGILEPR